MTGEDRAAGQARSSADDRTADSRGDAGRRDAPSPHSRWRCRPAPPYRVPTGCRRVVLPFIGFVLDADDDHRRRVDRWFQIPMLVLALLVLPILVVHHYVVQQPRLSAVLDILLGVIWVAFFLEFLIKITIARSRAQYCLKNWLDLVIIALPFLRPFRAARAARILQLTRAYTLRGVGMKLFRTGVAFVVGTQVVRRWQVTHAKTEPPADAPPDYAQWSKAALIAEIERLRHALAAATAASTPAAGSSRPRAETAQDRPEATSPTDGSSPAPDLPPAGQ